MRDQLIEQTQEFNKYCLDIPEEDMAMTPAQFTQWLNVYPFIRS